MSFIVYNSGFESGIEKKTLKKQNIYYRIILIYNYYIHISFFDFYLLQFYLHYSIIVIISDSTYILLYYFYKHTLIYLFYSNRLNDRNSVFLATKFYIRYSIESSLIVFF